MDLAKQVNTFGQWLLRRYGERVHKIAVDAAFTSSSLAKGYVPSSAISGFSRTAERSGSREQSPSRRSMRFRRGDVPVWGRPARS